MWVDRDFSEAKFIANRTYQLENAGSLPQPWSQGQISGPGLRPRTPKLQTAPELHQRVGGSLTIWICPALLAPSPGLGCILLSYGPLRLSVHNVNLLCSGLVLRPGLAGSQLCPLTTAPRPGLGSTTNGPSADTGNIMGTLSAVCPGWASGPALSYTLKKAMKSASECSPAGRRAVGPPHLHLPPAVSSCPPWVPYPGCQLSELSSNPVGW